MSDYKFLFPFELVSKDSRIIIYGAGLLGQEYLRQIITTKYCNVIAMVDKMYNEIPAMIVPVCSPADISTLKFDYAVIALRSSFGLNEVMEQLKKTGVAKEKIVFVSERENIPVSVFSKKLAHNLHHYAYEYHNPAVSIYLKGGMGDMIIYKRFIQELIKEEPSIIIDLYTHNQKKFLDFLYSDVRQIGMIHQNLDKSYEATIRKYDLSLTVCAFVTMDYFDETNFKNIAFVNKMKKLSGKIKEMEFYTSNVAYVLQHQRIYKKENAYTGYSYGGIFNINDKKVHIPMIDSISEELSWINHKQYYTINYGNGECLNGSIVAKSWSVDNFHKVIKLLKKKYPNVECVQLGGPDNLKIDDVDKYCMGLDFNMVSNILSKAIFHLDIEGGLVHLASQLGTKCVVLFGPTNVYYYGYEQNVNIKAGSCHDCYSIYKEINACARGLDIPECMAAITPEIVFEKIVPIIEKVD